MLDLSKQVKSLFDDLEEHKALLVDQHETVRKLQAEKDALKYDKEQLNSSLQDLQDNFDKELAGARREVQDSRNKSKQVHESKVKLETDLLSAKMECAKLENELGRQQEAKRALEAEQAQLKDAMRGIEVNFDSISSVIKYHNDCEYAASVPLQCSKHLLLCVCDPI